MCDETLNIFLHYLRVLEKQSSPSSSQTHLFITDALRNEEKAIDEYLTKLCLSTHTQPVVHMNKRSAQPQQSPCCCAAALSSCPAQQAPRHLRLAACVATTFPHQGRASNARAAPPTPPTQSGCAAFSNSGCGEVLVVIVAGDRFGALPARSCRTALVALAHVQPSLPQPARRAW